MTAPKVGAGKRKTTPGGKSMQHKPYRRLSFSKHKLVATTYFMPSITGGKDVLLKLPTLTPWSEPA